MGVAILRVREGLDCSDTLSGDDSISKRSFHQLWPTKLSRMFDVVPDTDTDRPDSRTVPVAVNCKWAMIHFFCWQKNGIVPVSFCTYFFSIVS